MDNQKMTYLNILIDTLRKKKGILDNLTVETEKQEKLLAAENLDFDAFDKVVENKDRLLTTLIALDDGFTDLYARVREEIRDNSNEYKEQIVAAQELIRCITEASTALQAMEQRNKSKFELILSQGRKKIKDFKMSNRTVAKYYNNMTNKHRNGDSYFLDRKE